MREFKYMPEDFGPLKVKVLHMDLTFDVFDDHTEATSVLKLAAKEVLDNLDLDAKNLELHSLEVDFCESEYEFDAENDVIHIKFKEKIPQEKTFSITTKSTCKPTKHILEGLYFDETPDGAPPTQITQCQQWGFQRIVPCIDRMNAKCTYHTTIRADKSYTNLITNGDLDKPVKDVGEGRVEVAYDNTVTPMATYLFFLGIGTYATFTKEFVYPNGDSFMLELLVPPDSEKEIAEQALEVLHGAVMWVHLFTGPDTYENWENSQKVWDLMKAGKREEAWEIAGGMKLGYKYTGKVYREIGMQNSDFGGMENVGNTTVTTNRIMPYPVMSDRAFEYMMRVKAHEYYHNLNGSEVTGHSPFEIWLNEAVTVFIENKFSSYFFGEDYERLDTVQGIIAPQSGTLTQDLSPASMPVEPDGFNDPNELITGITYVKAPEFVRMIETLMGKENFAKALDNYHTKFKHSNAKWQEWIKCMEEVSKMNFKNMAKVWLKRTGWPTVDVKREQVGDNCILHLRQEGEAYEFPFSVALFDDEGKKLGEQIAHIKEKEQDIIFEGMDPAFVSLNRGFSFYGRVKHKATKHELMLQVQFDDDVVARYIAYDTLFARERLKILKEGADLSDELIDLYFELISDKELMSQYGGQFLAFFDSVEDEKFSHRYQLLYDIREKMYKAIAEKYKDELLAIYNALAKKKYEGSVVKQRIDSIKDRQVKNSALSILTRLDTPDIHEIVKKQFEITTNATDKLSAFRWYLKSSAADKMEMLEEYEEAAKKNLVTWETFLASVARNEAEDSIAIMKKVEDSESFRIEQANDQRALFAVFAHNKRKSLLTDEGREFVKQSILRLAPINEYNTLSILESFGTLEKIEPKHQVQLVKLLVEVLKELPDKKLPSVTSYIKRLLKGSPKALEAYGAKFGKIGLKF
ncbi:MAG: DUF3458 domain-containing protein [Candidatus Nanoarchaeia archaeon]